MVVINKWRKFEESVYEIQKKLSGNSNVEFNYKVKGKLTNRSRQVDIAMFNNIGSYHIFIAIECKDYNRKIGIEHVESFAQKIEDIGANVGVLISSKGFTKSVINLAKIKNIEAKRLIDECNKDYRINVKLPVLYQFKEISSFNLNVRNLSQEEVKLNTKEWRNMVIYDEYKNILGNVDKLLCKCWNQQNDDVAEGVHSYNIENAKLLVNDVFKPFDIKIDYKVSVMYFKFWVRFDQFKGFLDERTNKLNAVEFKTEALDVFSEKFVENQVSKDEFQSNNTHLVITYLKDFIT